MSTNDRRAKINEIIDLNLERHTRLQEEEDFEAHYHENILQALDDVVRQVVSERSREASTSTAPLQKERVSMAMRDFFAHFEGTYQSLMAAMFPGVSLTAGTRSAHGGTRLDTTDHSGDGAAAPQGHAQQRALTPEEEKVRARLPAWVVVPYAEALWPGSQFAILWTGEGDAPDLPPLELTLDGQPQGEDVLGTGVETDVDGLPTGKVTFIQLNKELKPKAFTIVEGKDGRLVVDFMT